MFHTVELVMKARPALTRDNWIAAARSALIRQGIEGVKVDRLARKLKLTRGSFYHHFKSRKALLYALQLDWELRNEAEIAQVRNRWAAAKPDLSEVIAVWVNADPYFPAFDVAMRMWARQSKAVAAVVHRIDDCWITLLTALFRSSGVDEDESLVRARVTYYHQVGYYALGVREPRDRRIRLLPLYYRVLTGRATSPGFRILYDSLSGGAPAGRRKQAGTSKRGQKTPCSEPPI